MMESLTFSAQLLDVLPAVLAAVHVNVPASSIKVSRINKQVTLPSNVISKSLELSIKAPNQNLTALFKEGTLEKADPRRSQNFNF